MTERIASSESSERVAVIGLGDVLLGDDAFGPLTIEFFRCGYQCGSNVQVLDLGTPGMELTPYLDGRKLVVVLDAVRAELPPGTLSILREDEFVYRRARLRLSDNDSILWRSLAQLGRVGRAPAEVLVVGVTPESCGLGAGVSPDVLGTAWDAADAVGRLLVDRGIRCCRRTPAAEPDLWWMRPSKSRRSGAEREAVRSPMQEVMS
jgi:hydrogenase maturation protease